MSLVQKYYFFIWFTEPWNRSYYFYSVYYRYTWVTGKEPLTYYDMNLSAQDHQTFFTGDTQQLRPEDAGELYKVKSMQSMHTCNTCQKFLFFMMWSTTGLYTSTINSHLYCSKPRWSSSYSDAEGLEREKSSSQDQSSLSGHRDQPPVSSTRTQWTSPYIFLDALHLKMLSVRLH